MTMEQMFDFIANNGFAVVIAIYMIVVNNNTVKKNTEATNKLVELIEKFLDKQVSHE